MASVVQHGEKWRAFVEVGGKRKTKVFERKRDADAWAAAAAAELATTRAGKSGDKMSLRDAFRRYAEDVAPGRKGGPWEIKRLLAFERHRALPVTLPLNKLTSQHLTAWRDARLKATSAGTVLREFSLLGSVLSYCRQDWGWITHDPIAAVRKPASPKPLERVITWREAKAMLRALNYRTRRPVRSTPAQVGAALLLALRTGMRSGEIVGLMWADVRASWVTLRDTKNGDARNVPVSKKALRVLEQLRGLHAELVFTISDGVRDAVFRQARGLAGLSGFTFHSARHTAATRIARTVGQPGRLSFAEFCKVFGWRDPRHAMIYVNPSAADLAAKL